MRKITFPLFLVAVLACGCTLQDENPNWNPKADLPAWVYDAPFYYRPTEDIRAFEMVGPGIPIYYTNQEFFFLKHPEGQTLTGEPRIAVWCTTDQKNWDRVGYFGAEQSHFLMRAENDGPHWMRFVGPGQETTEVPPGQPQRIYVVDRQPPQIVMTLEPEPYTTDKEGNRIPYIYKVGEKVVLGWQVVDANLRPETIKLGTCFPNFPHNLVWDTFPHSLEASGSLPIEIPPEALQDGGLRFRMEATDKADNVGMVMTEILHVEGGGKPGPQPGVRPIAIDDPVHQTEGTPNRQRPGWPSGGSFLRGGTTREIAWMPANAKEYKNLDFQFSSNNGQSWNTIATNVTPGTAFRWTVPEVTSKDCMLRLVGLNKSDKKVAIVTSGRFTVDTVVPMLNEEPQPVTPK
jgi:hypothetical protein